jgi:hypothetical protein
MKRLFFNSLFILLVFTFSCTKETKQEFELWYDQPAQDWMTEALPI